MEAKQLKLKQRLPAMLALLAALLGLGALLLLGRSTQNSETFGRIQDWLLIINAIGALILLLLITSKLIRLLRDYFTAVPGARLRARLLAIIVSLTLAPLVVVYLFAVQFLNKGIDTWFDIEVQAGLSDALTLSRSALDTRIQENMRETRRLATEILNVDASERPAVINAARQETGATSATLYGRYYLPLVTSHSDVTAPLPGPPPEDMIFQLRQSGSYVGINPVSEGIYEVRLATVLRDPRIRREALVLATTYPVDERIASLVDSVEQTYSSYNELLFLREPLKTSFALTLTLVLLLSLLTAVYGAFYFARRLIEPVLSVVDGTRAVAAGDFDTRLPVTSHDEIGFLIDSFNQMIQRLDQAREEARASERLVRKQRARIEAILARLTTGVIAVESDGRIRIANAAADSLLEADITRAVGSRLADLANTSDALQSFLSSLEQRFAGDTAEWREQVKVSTSSGSRTLVCASAELPADSGGNQAYVIVFDDVTQLLQAQKDAAWGEVARRLAHEIKNPLTPIQLSAERIRRRYLDNMQDLEGEILDRATSTIIAQVEAMRDMVNAFSEYARAPQMNLTRFDLHRLVREVMYLYTAANKEVEVTLTLTPDELLLDADSVRLRQLLHNLVRNAFEALEGLDEPHLKIVTQLIEVRGQDYVEITVSDNGPGFSADMQEQIFEPYATTKNKGTGLGLAIVKKLVEDHGGSVTAINGEHGGAIVMVRLPASAVNEPANSKETA